MKKFVLSAIVLLLTLPSYGYTQNMTFDDGTTWNCDQNFDPIPLRYYYQYGFGDVWNNPASVPAYMNTFSVRYKDSSYLRVGQTWSDGTNFDWTAQLRQNNFAIPAGSSMEIISTFANDWAVLNHPAVRTGNDFTIAYQTSYDYSNNYPDASDDIQHVECQPYYITWCGDGVVDPGYETCDPAAPGQSPTTCSPTTCTPIVTPPVCNPAKTGTQPAPVLATDTLCNVGTVSAFVATASGNTTNYTWSCNTNTAVNCSANYTVVPTSTGSFDLSIKKYAKSEDVFASVDNTENYNYTIVVRNNGTGAVTGTTTVKDKLPAPITLRATPSGNGWTCTGAAGAADFTCTTTKSYAPDTEFDVITVPVQITNLVFRPEGYVNYAYVQNPNETLGKQCNTNGSMPDPSLGGTNGQTPTAVCNEDKNNFDPATVNPPNPNGFDLKLKKFVNGDDESSPVRPGGTATYTFVMQNLGAQASTGTTTVTDESFPAGVTIASIAATQGEWSCTKNSDTKFTCTTTKSYAAGEYATPITLTAGIASTMAVGTYRNVACLSNPSDPNENQILDPSTGKYKVNNCDPAEVVVVPASAFDLSIKKYVADTTTGTAERDGDHQTTNDGTDVNRDILTIPQGGTARYRFVIKNEGPATATGLTTVEDTLPNGFTITGSVVGTGWSCSVTGNGNRSFSCTRTENLAVGASFPEIVVNALSDAAILAGEYSNTATVKNPGDANPDNNTDPANVQIVTGFDLSLKKYISTGTGVENDAQIGSGLTLNSGLSMNYVIRVKNEGPQTTTGTTTVRDVLPTGVTASGAATGSGWICTASGVSLSCDTTQVVISGAYYTDITVPVRITAGANTTVTNYAVVYNPNELNPCKTDGSMPAGNETTCTKDPRNIDPAQFTVPGGGGGSDTYIGKVCINNVASCANYATLSACTSAGVPASLCYVANASGSLACQNQSLSCGGGGGGGGGGGNYCGDGVLQAGEECDVVGAAWCVSCKLDLWTNPGANPITDLWITIPTLSNTRFGYDWIDGQLGKLPFSSNGVVTGVGGKVFTFADVVGFGVKTKYTIPLMIEADKQICLKGTGNSIDNNTICTTFGEAAAMSSNNDVSTFTRQTDGKKYVILGKGDYQYQTVVNGVYYGATSNSANSIDLFRGPTLYRTPQSNNGPTLNSAFQGVRTGTDGNIALVACTGGDCSVDLAHMGVRVSGAMIGTSGTPVNRSIATFVQTTPQSILAGFGIGTQSTTTTSTTTNTVATNTLGNVSLNGVLAYPSGLTVAKLVELPALNGNQNIRAIKGNLTIACPSGTNAFIMEGVRTVIVEGNIIFKCNTVYADANSSWAWIAKGGNIMVDNGDGTVNNKGITNLAGVYVAIGDTSSTGKFTALEDKTTNAILKIDGSLYGNANPLFTSRLYARGTSAYDILTTGTIITYSNRALVNPPPLLSQYLGNYSVERVVK